MSPAVSVLRRPFHAFFRTEAASGVLLLACAVVALLWANGPLASLYFASRDTLVTVGVGPFALSKPLIAWINDGLMAVFFFLVGLEIKREALVGELATPRKAILPLAAALGGMLVPALIYAAFNAGRPTLRGWGIPMATDIAFALGALALANRAGVHRGVPYAVLGVGLWLAFLKSGVHATIAGVLLAMTIPARRRIDGDEFLERGRALLDTFATEGKPGTPVPTENQRDAVSSLEVACRDVEAPLTRLERLLHPWVAYAIVPIFALANAGVGLDAEAISVRDPVTLGIVLGLVLGKQAGVTLFAWVLVRAGAAVLPTGATWGQLYGVACLCGIGFTMSLFVANLAFTDPAVLDHAKIGILTASLVSGVWGLTVLARAGSASRGGRARA